MFPNNYMYADFIEDTRLFIIIQRYWIIFIFQPVVLVENWGDLPMEQIMKPFPLSSSMVSF